MSCVVGTLKRFSPERVSPHNNSRGPLPMMAGLKKGLTLNGSRPKITSTASGKIARPEEAITILSVHFHFPRERKGCRGKTL